ncbi:HlyC/CorC family transporter [uncultured Maritimibacter sp.]|jgi:Mg2+/Co2+ transporter CorB|uniref:HlyC/CorC family transporter n=1 Tax=uncultured Maritimibacter sp. TaxID=991866 RepID=UPI000B1029DB|nr:HlyC/CorC family transporter [uncultured Maritimibacter sp.]
MTPADTGTFDPTLWIMAGAILLLLVFSAFFSGSETAMTAASRGKLRSKADKGDKRAERALHITEDTERLIGSVLLGNNFVNILASALATTLFTRLLGDGAIAIATLVMTLLVLIFAEVLPKTYAITRPEEAASAVSAPIRIIIIVLSPIVGIVRLLTRLILRLFGVQADPDAQLLGVREEIVGAITLGHHEGAVEKEDRDRLLGALDLGDRTVEEIMLHRSQIEMIDASLGPREVLEQALASPHTRLPIYEGEQENIVGVIHAKDLSRAMYAAGEAAGDGNRREAYDNFDVLEVAMEPYFIPETTTLDDQMREFLKRQTHFALVVDEYGSLQGLITLEDILEEIVGEITDEFDASDPGELRALADGSFSVDGGMTIRDLNRANDWSLPDEEANTVAGLVIHEAQMIPNEGQVFSFHGFRFEVTKRVENRIARLRIRKLTV